MALYGLNILTAVYVSIYLCVCVCIAPGGQHYYIYGATIQPIQYNSEYEVFTLIPFQDHMTTPSHVLHAASTAVEEEQGTFVLYSCKHLT